MSRSTPMQGPASPVMRPPEILVPLVRQELAEGATHDHAATTHYRAAGALLLEAKQGLKHGQFKAWIAANFEFSYSSAALYMRMASSNVERVRHVQRDASTRRKAHTRPTKLAASSIRPEDKQAVRMMAEEFTKAGFRAMAAKYHPDKPGGSAERMKLVNQVRALLVEGVFVWW